ncbi:MAG: hypothetical protein JW854_13340 [Actinobacteria bacterium]|nr:hypothetical protein [Actinomycetota bacterium]
MGIVACSKCGVPKRVGAKHEWKDNGVIVARGSDMRGVWMESDLLGAVLGGIEEQLGISIDNIVIDAKRRGAKIYVDSMLAGPRGAPLHFRPLRKIAYLYMIRQAEAIGLAKSRIASYKAGDSLLLEAELVYHDPIFTGDVCGAFESIERIRARAGYEREGNITRIEINAWEDAPEEERLQVDYGKPGPARAGFERCQACGTPLQVRNWYWDLENGKVTDGASGEWIIFIDIGGINAVFRELERELGEDIPHMLAEQTRSFYRGLRERKPDAFQQGIAFIKTRGFGVPASDNPSPEEMAAGIEILNPFNAPMVAGAVVGSLVDGDTFGWKVSPEGALKVLVG